MEWPKFTREEIAIRTAEDLARMSADPKSTKRPSHSERGKAAHLAAMASPFSSETAKHYRRRNDGAIIRATPKATKRRRKIKPKEFHPPSEPRQSAVELSRLAIERNRERRKAVEIAVKGLPEMWKRKFGMLNIRMIASAIRLSANVVKDQLVAMGRMP